MKKRILCSLLALLTLLALTVCVFASEPQLYNVTDTAGLLTDEQNSQLEKHAAETAAKYGVGVYIVTVDDYAMSMKQASTKRLMASTTPTQWARAQSAAAFCCF